MKRSLISRVFCLALIGIMSIGMLSGCGKKEADNEVVMTDDDKAIRELLIKSFDAMAESGNVQIDMANAYKIKMRTTTDGIQMNVTVDSNYTGHVKLLKGSGFGLSVDNDYTTYVESTSTSTPYSDTSNDKSVFVTYYDEPNGTYYYTLGEDNKDVTWYRSKWDGKQMLKDFYDAISNADVNYTMETGDTTYKITFDYASLSEQDTMKKFFEKYEEDMNSIDEYLDILGNAKNGMATFIINKDTMLLSEMTVTNISIDNTSAQNMFNGGSDISTDDMVIGDMSISAKIGIKFNNYGNVTQDDIDYYKSRSANAKDADAAEAEGSLADEKKPSTDGDTAYYYEDNSLTDTHNVSKYKIEDITNDDLNNIRFAKDKDYEHLYIKPNVLTNYGWEYNIPSDDEKNPPATFTHNNYVGAMMTLLKEKESTTYEDMISDGAIGLEVNLLNTALVKADMPDMSFTNYNIKFGMKEDEVLKKLGRPDVVYIGKYYTQYQYSTYSVSVIGEVDTVSVVFTFYHYDDVDGLYDVDMERYLGRMKPNVGNVDVDAQVKDAKKSESAE